MIGPSVALAVAIYENSTRAGLVSNAATADASDKHPSAFAGCAEDGLFRVLKDVVVILRPSVSANDEFDCRIFT